MEQEPVVLLGADLVIGGSVDAATLVQALVQTLGVDAGDMFLGG